MKKLLILSIGFFILALPLIAQADLFTFSGIDEGGIGSATMDITGSGTNSWTIQIDNTSPTTLISSSDPNAPAITMFGWDVSDGSANISSWTLQARNDSGALINISSDWNLITPGSIGSFSLDALASTSTGPGGGVNVKGGLYNPLWEGAASPPLGADPNYFTSAILNIIYQESETLLAFAQNSPPDGSPFVRMQNVGRDGEGSLKLNPIPEPATMLLLGSGLVGFALVGRKKFFKK